MESITSSLRSSLLPSLPLPSGKPQPRFGLTIRRSGGKILATRRDSYQWNYGQLLVDENMIVLRKRIHEMKMIERNYEPPSEWMEWEKQCYTSYNEFVCKFVGFLQFQLMNTRPSLALGMLLLITMSVPVSTATIAFRFMEVAGNFFSAVHIG